VNERIRSKIFGVVMKATPAQRETIENLVLNFPVDVYQCLNKALNAKGLMLGIATKREQTLDDPRDNLPMQKEGDSKMLDTSDIMSDPRIRESGPVSG
jgi:hypothetical protein